ncbi:hypothetical protein EI94DRAFT_1741091 [Lactarius quietus]|nr:hypothetical protein EI94DRAFT_1741091 [Lactarius quietus]
MSLGLEGLRASEIHEYKGPGSVYGTLPSSRLHLPLPFHRLARLSAGESHPQIRTNQLATATAAVDHLSALISAITTASPPKLQLQRCLGQGKQHLPNTTASLQRQQR